MAQPEGETSEYPRGRNKGPFSDRTEDKGASVRSLGRGYGRASPRVTTHMCTHGTLTNPNTHYTWGALLAAGHTHTDSYRHRHILPPMTIQ